VAISLGRIVRGGAEAAFEIRRDRKIGRVNDGALSLKVCVIAAGMAGCCNAGFQVAPRKIQGKYWRASPIRAPLPLRYRNPLRCGARI
jgi:hypothetical protein